MDIEIQHGPGNAAAKIHLHPRETVIAEGGAMIAMSSDLHVETTTHNRGGGGILKGLKRLLAGESFFINHFTSGDHGGNIIFAADLPGDMMEYRLDGDTLIVQAGSFVCSSSEVTMDMSWQGFGKAFLSGERAFWLKIGGHGQVVLSSFGAIYPVEVNGEYIVDTGHIVAFNETLNFSVTKAGGSWMTALLGGEGLVCKFQGQGTVWCQSHIESTFGRALGPLLKPRS